MAPNQNREIIRLNQTQDVQGYKSPLSGTVNLPSNFDEYYIYDKTVVAEQFDVTFTLPEPVMLEYIKIQSRINTSSAPTIPDFFYQNSCVVLFKPDLNLDITPVKAIVPFDSVSSGQFIASGRIGCPIYQNPGGLKIQIEGANSDLITGWVDTVVYAAFRRIGFKGNM